MKKKTTHAFCVHGHFYQPTREDPITGKIPVEPGAAPFANWNERINSQCYQPNAALGNFEGISFNIGPTLFSWLEKADPLTLERIIEQERANVRRYGVGNGMAQAYHHIILPLATKEDKWTQIVWGIEDFRYRFGHHPAGMWLPETAVDLETLDMLAQNNIQFTILAPWQAKEAKLDVSKPYWVKCHEGRKIVVFFYHRDLSTRVSFDPGATANADQFALRVLMPQFHSPGVEQDADQFLLIASDGEAYGHHHPFRDKFLSYLLNKAIRNHPVEKSFPALWLQNHTPKDEIEIEDDTSWSCHHGVKRWSQECGCTPYGGWKQPLRQAMNQIAAIIDEVYTAVCGEMLVDGWHLRNEYIKVIHGSVTISEILEAVGGKTYGKEEINRISLLLSAQNERQRMFASCAWFFDDFDRIEPRNGVQYAVQALWLIEKATGKLLYDNAKKALSKVISKRSGITGDIVFEAYLQKIYDSLEEPIGEFSSSSDKNSSI